jgi:hypothetical protein
MFKKLVFKSCILVFSIGALINAACWDYKFFPTYMELEERVQQTKKVKTTTFVFGDSHPDVLKGLQLDESWVLLTQPSDNIIDVKRKIEMVLELSPSVERVIIQAEPYIISNYRMEKNNNSTSKSISAFHDKSIFNFLNWVRLKVPILDPKQHYLFRSNFFKWIRGHDFAIVQKENVAFNGNIPYKRVKEQYGAGLSQVLFQELDSLIKMLKRKDIQVIGVKFPLSSVYRKELLNYNFAEMERRINELEYDKVFDYSNLFDNNQLFKDSDHLNAKGAGIFLDQLKRDLN